MPRPAAIEALKELDPVQRALLDLSLNRELSDALIANLLDNVDESGVAGMRQEALAAVARAAAIEGPGATGEVERQLRSASDQQWLGAGETNGHANGRANGHANGNGNGVVATVPRPATRTAAPPRRPRSAQRIEPQRDDRSGRIWAVAFVLLALIGAVAIGVALIGGDDEAPPASGSAQNQAAPTPGTPAEPLALEALTPGAVAGSAAITPAAAGEGYVLRLEGLPQPDGYYRLWVYDSLIESAPVAGLASGSGTVDFDLPADAGNYESLDLSVETGPGDSIHSGQSLFRIPVADID